MTLKKKILLGYSVIFLIMGSVIIWAVSNLVSLGDATDAILSENYQSILAAENMVDALERQDSGILLMFLGDVQEGGEQYHKHEQIFYEWFARAKDNITIEGEKELIDSIQSDYEIYRRSVFNLSKRIKNLSEASSYQDRIYPLFMNVRDKCIQLRKLNEETMYTASINAGHVATRAIWSTALVAAIALIIALGFSMILAERIVKPVRAFMDASRKISAGDYSVQVPVKTEDELGKLAGEFNEMVNQLNHYHEMNIEQIIEEKKKGEAILSSIEDGLLVFDAGLKLSAINPAARKLFDLDYTETSTLECADIFTNSSLCELIHDTVIKGKEVSIPDEKKIITLSKNNETKHFLFSITVISGKKQQLSGIVLLLRDVTHLKEIERLKSEFVMTASHELRTPLTSLSMSIDLLLENSQDFSEENQQMLNVVHEEVHRMNALVNDLLDMTRIESGKIEMDFQHISIEPLFKHSWEVFKKQLETKNVQLTQKIPKGLPLVKADANKITWVITNLISNALRYVDEKNGHIHLEARQIGNFVHLSVQDNGKGIPLEYQTKIFQKFVQVKGQEPGGTGLGLAICKEIVRAHGGTIWVDSTENKGSTFTFTLPVVQQQNRG